MLQIAPQTVMQTLLERGLIETTGRAAADKRKRPEFDPSGRVMVMNGQPLADGKYQES